MANSMAHKRTHYTHFLPLGRKLKSSSNVPSEYVWVKLNGKQVRVKRSEAKLKGLEVVE